MRASARVVDAEAAAAPKVTVKAIQVRQVDKTITRPRGRDESSVSMDLHVSALSQTTPRPPVSGDGISTTCDAIANTPALVHLRMIMQKLSYQGCYSVRLVGDGSASSFASDSF